MKTLELLMTKVHSFRILLDDKDKGLYRIFVSHFDSKAKMQIITTEGRSIEESVSFLLNEVPEL